MRRLLSCLVALALFPAAVLAQQPGAMPKPKNLKVFPKDIPVRALLDTMGTFTRALGVRCTYCHVGQEGQPLSSFDFKSDEKPEKDKARAMLRMVASINGDHLAKLAARRTPSVDVTCMTCHRGVAVPRTLQQTLVAAYDAGGADSALAAYRALRERYYGRASYDFGEVPLADVGAILRSRGKLADALRFYLLNTEMSPSSAFAFRMAGDAQLTSGDTAAAIASLEKAATLAPNDPQVRRALDALKKK